MRNLDIGRVWQRLIIPFHIAPPAFWAYYTRVLLRTASKIYFAEFGESLYSVVRYRKANQMECAILFTKPSAEGGYLL